MCNESITISYFFCTITDEFSPLCYTQIMKFNLSELLTEFKRQNGLTNEYIAEYCNVTCPTVSRWCTGKIRKVAPETMDKLAEMLRLDMEDLNKVSGFNFERPLLGTVKAGYGLLADENVEGYVPVSESDYARGDYFLRVTGDSMKDAHIHEGDLLYVKQTNDVPSGSIAVLLIEGEEVTVKKLIKKDKYWILQAANSDVEPRIYTSEEIQELPVQIIGRALYSRREL